MRYSETLHKSYPYVMEMILLYMLLMLSYIHTEHLPPILPFLLITGAGSILLVFILSQMKSKTPYLFIILVVPLLAFLGSLVGLPFGQSLVIAILVCYRIIVRFYRHPRLTEVMVLNVSLLLGGIIYFAASVQGYIHHVLILYLLVTQLLVFMIGKMLTSVSSSPLVMKKVALKTNSWYVVGLFSGLFVASIGVAVVFPIIFMKVLSYVSSIIGTALYHVAKPLFNAVDDFEASGTPQGERVDPLNWDETENKHLILETAGSFNGWIFLAIFGSLILIVMIYLLAKKRFVKERDIAEDVFQYTAMTEELSKTIGKRIRPKKQTPQAKVRKLILELEMLSAKYGQGRFPHESVTEWLGRNHFLDERIVELYEKVRYGDEVLSPKENEACEEIIKKIKQKIKTVRNARKKNLL